jgi:hypothetical protein
VGGTKLVIPEFGLTQAIVFTGNSPTGVVVRFQEQLHRMRKLAAQWNHDLAEVELDKVTRVQTQLDATAHAVRDSRELLDNARNRLRTCVDYWNNGDFLDAYLEAERSMRPLRILMRAQWDDAIRGLDSPVSSPYAVSYYTLPRHFRFMDQVRHCTAGANVLPDGNFELAAGQVSDSWTAQEARLDAVDMTAQRVAEFPQEGRQCLKIEIKPQNPQMPPKALERTFLGIRSPTVRLPPGSIVRISGWVRIMKAITASVDGALVYDSAGGEPLAIRLTEPTLVNKPVIVPDKTGKLAPVPGATINGVKQPDPVAVVPDWKHFALYREVPASGSLNVTLALTGLGTVYFDDIRIEPMQVRDQVSGIGDAGLTPRPLPPGP